MRVFKEGRSRQSFSILREVPFALEIRQGIPGTAHFRSGGECHIGCLGCSNPRCIYLDEREIECDAIEGFPSDKSVNACPVEAIAWSDDRGTPIIDASTCIHCGICVSRCPVGALYFTNSGDVTVHTELGEWVEKRPSDAATRTVHTQQIEQLLKVPRAGVSLNASDQIFEMIYEKLFRLRSAYHNMVGRNLLIALGCTCSMRRIGDVYARMDAVYASPARIIWRRRG